jgi:site-specific DNA recombinase
MKRFLGFVRVSSREQEREGFSLDVQEEALRKYAAREGGKIVRMFRIAETATRHEERKTFKEVIKYGTKHSKELDGILFYKLDRAARNLKDYVALEDLEEEHGLPFISVSQPTENTPAGRMMRRTLANMATFFAEQHSLDVREGIERRVRNGLPPNRPSYGYRNVRKNGRSLIEVHPDNGPKVQRVFELYAYHGLTVTGLVERLAEEGITYSTSKARFSPSKAYAILTDRYYIGEVRHRDVWHPGIHKPLVDSETWDRVQVLLGQKIYRSRQTLYAGELIVCGFCGHPVCGEVKEKWTKAGLKNYVYYRCARYHLGDHPRIRLREQELDEQVVALFGKMDAECDAVRSWMIATMQKRTEDAQRAAGHRITELKRQLSRVTKQQDELLELRLSSKIDDTRFETKQAELQQRLEKLRQQTQSCTPTGQQSDKVEGKGADVFRMILDEWPTAEFTIKRRILEIVFRKFTLVEKTLVPSNRTPFELLAAG